MANKSRHKPPVRIQEPATETPHPSAAPAGHRLAAYELAVVAAVAGLILVASNSVSMISLCVLWAASLYAGARFVFPHEPDKQHELFLANALAVFLILRVLVDGVVHREANLYFFWAACAIFAVWAGHAALRGGACPKERLLLCMPAAFLAAALLVSPWSIQFDGTFRALLQWASYVMICTVAACGLRSRLGQGIVLSALACVAIGEAVYAVLHLKYLLPLTRAVLQDHPELLAYHAGKTGGSPFEQRLYSNRAYGSFVYANALAAFFLPAALFSMGAAASRIIKLWELAKRPKNDVQENANNYLEIPWFAAVAVWAVSSAITFAAYSACYYRILFHAGPWTAHPWPWIFYTGLVPLAMAYLAYDTVHRRGAHFYGMALQTAACLAAFTLSVVGLILTYSRGGLLAFLAALACMSLLLFMRRGLHGRLPAPAIVLIACTAIVSMGADTPPTPEGQAGGIEEAAPGHAPGMEELANLSTAALRMTYWRTGLRMAADRPLAGVGLGNFGAAYPAYQYPGAGDVTVAHNDYLQALCETGLLGFAAFIGFWAWLLAHGARRIRLEENASERWLMAGLFAGLLAFLMHAAMDFDFNNPSLASLEFMLAGVFIAMMQTPDSWRALKPRGRAALGGLALAALVLGASAWPLPSVDALVGDRAASNARMEAARYLFTSCAPDAPEPAEAPRITLKMLQPLISERSELEAFGVFQTRNAGAEAWADIAPDTPLSGAESFVISNRAAGWRAAHEAVLAHIAAMEQTDARYPHSPSLASRLCQFYQLLASFENDPKQNDPKQLERFVDSCVNWGEKAVRRGPFQASHRVQYAGALWLKGGIAQADEKAELLKRSAAEYQEAARLYPTSQEVWSQYSSRANTLGNALLDAGFADEGRKYLRQGAEAAKHAETLPPRAG